MRRGPSIGRPISLVRARPCPRRWHPDKFAHRFGAALREAERAAVLALVQDVAQRVNGEWDRLRSAAGL